jgi:hypothetical protein
VIVWQHCSAGFSQPLHSIELSLKVMEVAETEFEFLVKKSPILSVVAGIKVQGTLIVSNIRPKVSILQTNSTFWSAQTIESR